MEKNKKFRTSLYLGLVFGVLLALIGFWIFFIKKDENRLLGAFMLCYGIFRTATATYFLFIKKNNEITEEETTS